MIQNLVLWIFQIWMASVNRKIDLSVRKLKLVYVWDVKIAVCFWMSTNGPESFKNIIRRVCQRVTSDLSAATNNGRLIIPGLYSIRTEQTPPTADQCAHLFSTYQNITQTGQKMVTLACSYIDAGSFYTLNLRFKGSSCKMSYNKLLWRDSLQIVNGWLVNGCYYRWCRIYVDVLLHEKPVVEIGLLILPPYF